jgi:hypothetical protein
MCERAVRSPKQPPGPGTGARPAEAARESASGYFDVKAFGNQSAACARYPKGRPLADAVEFLGGRSRASSQRDDGDSRPRVQPTTAPAEGDR